MAESRHKRRPGFRKRHMEAQKEGAKAFTGGNLPGTSQWTCPECKVCNPSRRDACGSCGAKKPEPQAQPEPPKA